MKHLLAQDIEGTRPKKKPIYAVRNCMDNKDIDGSRPRKNRVWFHLNLGTYNKIR